VGGKKPWAELAGRNGRGVIDPILIDECLSPELVAVALMRGLVATHVIWLDRDGTVDWDLAALAAERDDVFVTNNRRDFLWLYAALEVHNGLIIIVPSVGAEEQRRLFGVALDAAEQQDSPVNLLIEVHADGTVKVRNWAKSDPTGAG
jgi:predicted nuclease of predicted toxin-antitoxin system